MKVLLVVTREPELNGKGDAKLAFQAGTALVDAGHELRTVHHTSGLRWSQAGRALLSVPFSRRPPQLALTHSRGFATRVSEALKSPTDVVVAVHARAAQHIPASWTRRCFLLMVDAFGRNYVSYRGQLPLHLDLAYRLEASRMAEYERDACRRFGGVGVVSPVDVRFLRSYAQVPEQIVHLPQAVDVGYFSATEHRRDPNPVFVFIGRLNYVPNRHAATRLLTEIWPLLKARWPAARLRIAGADPTRKLIRLAMKCGAQLEADVPDIRPILGSATAVVVPMSLGGGVQNKLLEAMAARVPVICTPFANEGIEAKDGTHLLLANTAEEFVRQCVRVVDNPGWAESLSTHAHAWVSGHHTQSRFAGALMPAVTAAAQGAAVRASSSSARGSRIA